MSDAPHDPEGVEELAAVAGDLKGSIDALNKSFDVLSGKSRTTRRVMYAIGTLSVLKVVTIVVLIVIIANISHDEDEQQKLRVKTLCPLYGLFINAVNNPDVPPSQRATPAQIKVITDGYDSLHCK